MYHQYYEVTVPVFIRHLENVRNLLKKAETHLEQTGQNEFELMTVKLTRDMLPFVRQVHLLTNTALGAVAELTDSTPPELPETETSLLELQLRIDRAVEWLSCVTPQQLALADVRTCRLPVLAGARTQLPGPRYITDFALPNFFFHATMSYALLRSFGVPLGKSDYIGPLANTGRSTDR